MTDHSDRKGRSSACRDVKFPSSKPKTTFFSSTLQYKSIQIKILSWSFHPCIQSDKGAEFRQDKKRQKDTLSSNKRESRHDKECHHMSIIIIIITTISTLPSSQRREQAWQEMPSWTPSPSAPSPVEILTLPSSQRRGQFQEPEQVPS